MAWKIVIPGFKKKKKKNKSSVEGSTPGEAAVRLSHRNEGKELLPRAFGVLSHLSSPFPPPPLLIFNSFLQIAPKDRYSNDV